MEKKKSKPVKVMEKGTNTKLGTPFEGVGLSLLVEKRCNDYFNKQNRK